MNATSYPASLSICGMRLLNLDMDDTIAAIEAALAARLPTRIAFVNADCINIASRNPAYRADLAAVDWVCADGAGMRLAGRLLQQPVRDNVNGTDMFPHLCAMLASRGRRLYLLGGRPGVAAAAGDWACAHHPGLVLAGCQHGYYPASKEAAVVAAIRASGADVILVALGAPRQEAWIARHLPDTGAAVGIGVGGLFDYYSGRIPRAPLWLRHLGLEWIFRLWQEPRRLARRYLLGNPLFLLRLAHSWLARQHHRQEVR